MRQAFASIVLMPLFLFLVACSSGPAPTDTPIPPPKTATRPALVSSSSTSSNNNSSASSSVANASSAAQSSATAVAMPDFPTTTPPPPTPVIPSGLYVTSLQTIPEIPVRGVDLTFYATFANNTNSPITFRWVVRIFKPDNPTKSFGQTTTTQFIDLGPGAKNQTSLGKWNLHAFILSIRTTRKRPSNNPAAQCLKSQWRFAHPRMCPPPHLVLQHPHPHPSAHLGCSSPICGPIRIHPNAARIFISIPHLIIRQARCRIIGGAF
jgi:hypothetical protein